MRNFLSKMSTPQHQQILQKRRDLKEMYKMKTSISNGTICTDGAVPYLSSIREEMTATTDFTECPIPKDCSVIMNGHYTAVSNGNSDGKEDGSVTVTVEDYYVGEESKPFLDKCHKKKLAKESVALSPPKTVEKSGAVNLASTEDSSSSEDDLDDGYVDGGGETRPETRLLRYGGAGEPLMGSSPKFKTTGFKLSPKKSSSESRNHIQHRPLGFQPSPAYSLEEGKFKLKWSMVKCLVSIVVVFLVCLLLSLAVVLIVSAPNRCKPVSNWWKNAVVYEIFPASFQDTDNDGFGDFRGIMARADYISNLSVDIIRLDSIFSALDYPLEYEHVIDFMNVDPHLGRMNDFKDLVTTVHTKGMYLVLDLNPTVTSDQHSWAAHWLLHRRYENFYVNYTDDDKVEPPMEKLSLSTRLRDRANPHRTFGSHIYLNWSNIYVQDEMLQVLRFWLTLGVDGFYMKHLEEMKLGTDGDMIGILSTWREVLDEFGGNNTTRRILAGSSQTLQKLQDMYRQSDKIASFFDVVDVGVEFSVGDIEKVSEKVTEIRTWVGEFSEPPWIWWHFGSVETTRLASRIGERFTVNGIFVLTLLPGTVSIFYGDEMGLKDSYETTSRKVYKGGQLTLMQWSSSANGNFTHGNVKPWLPVHPDFSRTDFGQRTKGIVDLGRLFYLKKSILQQVTDAGSTIKTFVHNINVRKHKEQPIYSWSRDPATDVLVVQQLCKTQKQVLLVSNFGKSPAKMDSVPHLKEDGSFDVRGLRLVFSTDTSFPQYDVTKGVLHPGHSVICIYDWD